MERYSFIAAQATLLFLAAALIVEYLILRRRLSKESAQNHRYHQQLAAHSTELKNLRIQLARKSEIAELFPRITKMITEKQSSDAYPAIAVRSVKEFFHAKNVGYFAPVEGAPDYTLVVGTGFPPDWVGKVRIHPDEGILGRAIQKRVVVSRMDPHSSSGRRPSRTSLEDILEVTPDFVAPVFGVSGAVGVLVVTGCPVPLEAERIYVSMLTDLLSMALQNATHLDPSMDGKWVDQLTGMANRLYFQQRFESEIRRTENYRHLLALFLFDIDEFKKINDTHGHQAGDVVIRKMAELVKKNTRSSDLVGRYGGDEFMVLITSTTEEQAVSYTDKLREKIATTDISIPGAKDPVRITVSGGLAIFPTHGGSTTELFRAADDALYESKRNGRNRILVASSTSLATGVAKGLEAGREAPNPENIAKDPVSGTPDYTLGEFGGDL